MTPPDLAADNEDGFQPGEVIRADGLHGPETAEAIRDGVHDGLVFVKGPCGQITSVPLLLLEFVERVEDIPELDCVPVGVLARVKCVPLGVEPFKGRLPTDGDGPEIVDLAPYLFLRIARWDETSTGTRGRAVCVLTS